MVELEILILVVDLDDCTLGKYSCVHADIVAVDILVKLLVFHKEEPVEQFGDETIVVSGGLKPVGAATEGISWDH